MVHKYIDPNKDNKHIQYQRAEEFKGTPSFASLSALKGYTQSRRDDIEGLAYILMYASQGQLPWQKYRDIQDYSERLDKIIESKSNVFYLDFIEKIPSCVVDLLKYWRSLQFKEKPNYRYIESLLQTEEISELKPWKPVHIILASNQDEEEKEVKLCKIDKASNRSITPNSSFTDQKHIKSFSFLKERSNNGCVASKFKVISDKALSIDSEGQESESSSVSDWSKEESKHGQRQIPENKKSTLIIHKPSNQPSMYSGVGGIKSTDCSPVGGKTFLNKISNMELKKLCGEDFSKDIVYNLKHSNSKNTSQKTLFFFHQSSKKLNFQNELQEDGVFKMQSKFTLKLLWFSTT